jgi:hypothetical protein
VFENVTAGRLYCNIMRLFNILKLGRKRDVDEGKGIREKDNIEIKSSLCPTNALNIRCSPYKTYNYIKYIKI